MESFLLLLNLLPRNAPRLSRDKNEALQISYTLQTLEQP